MAEVDKLVVKIAAEFGDLKKDLDDVKHQLKGLGEESKHTGVSFAAMGKSITAVATAATAMGVAVGVLIKKQADAARETKLWARRLDVASSKFSQLAVVGRNFGADMDTVGDAIKDLNERIADAARGNKTYEEALRAVGLESKKLINLPVEEQFIKVADAIGKMNNAGDRNFITAELMADAGFRLIPAFQQGEQAIRGMMKEAEKLGQAFTEEQVKDFDDLDKAFIRLEASSGALGRSLTSVLITPLTSAANLAADLAESLTLAHSEVGDGSQVMASGGAMMGNFAEATQAATKEVDNMTAALDYLAETRPEFATPEAPTVSTDSGAPEGGFLLGGTNVGAHLPEEQQAVFDLLLVNLLDYQENEFEYKNAQRERELEANQSFVDYMFEIDKKAQDKNLALWESGWKGKQMVASKFLGQISTLMNTNSRKQFEIGKAAAIAQVAIDTPKAAMSAYSAMAGIPVVGPALGGIAAAAAVATGVAQIQNIKSQSFGGGGGGAGGAIDAGGGAQGAQAGGGGDETLIDATFNIQSESGNVSADQIRGVAAGLNELIEDGGKLRSVTVI